MLNINNNNVTTIIRTLDNLNYVNVFALFQLVWIVERMNCTVGFKDCVTEWFGGWMNCTVGFKDSVTEWFGGRMNCTVGFKDCVTEWFGGRMNCTMDLR